LSSAPSGSADGNEPAATEVLPDNEADPKGPAHVLLHLPAGAAPSASLSLLAVIAVVAVLRWASAFFVPLMLGLVLSYALSPVVDALQRVRVPRALSAAVLLFAILGGVGGSLYAFSDDANDLIASLPDAMHKLRDAVQRRHGGGNTFDSVQKAAAELQRAAEEASTTAPAAGSGRPVPHVIVEKPKFDLREHLWTGTVGLATVIAQVVIVSCLTFFMLAAGDTYRRKLVKIAGPGLAEKKLTVQALDEINAQMQRYLLVQLLASVGTGLATGVAFGLIGLKHAVVWGIAAGVLNLIPYVGPIAITATSALVAFLQFGGSLKMALAVGAISMAIDTVKGYVLVPWATSKATRMNAVAVFVGVLAWGWLWGLWGLLLGMPILMAVKAVCDRVDHLKPVGELLGT
jgi:predicted PurR-regulated permease PerM